MAGAWTPAASGRTVAPRKTPEEMGISFEQSSHGEARVPPKIIPRPWTLPLREILPVDHDFLMNTSTARLERVLAPRIKLDGRPSLERSWPPRARATSKRQS